jgi:hypothetical protein
MIEFRDRHGNTWGCHEERCPHFGSGLLGQGDLPVGPHDAACYATPGKDCRPEVVPINKQSELSREQRRERSARRVYDEAEFELWKIGAMPSPPDIFE